jgi:hypothetical protein
MSARRTVGECTHAIDERAGRKQLAGSDQVNFTTRKTGASTFAGFVAGQTSDETKTANYGEV